MSNWTIMQKPKPTGSPLLEEGVQDELHELSLAEVFGQEYANHTLAEAFAKVERAKREWEATVDALPELICVVNEQGRLVRANRTVERWSLGLVVNVEGQEIHDFMHSDCDRSCYLSTFLQFARERAFNGHPVEHEAYDAILRRHLHIRVLPVNKREHDAQQHMAIIIHDITQRKEMEQALQQNNERLRVINTISSAILAARSADEIAKVVLQHVQALVPFQQAYVLLHEIELDKYRVLAASVSGRVLPPPNTSLPASALAQRRGRSVAELFMVGDLKQVKELSRFEEYIQQNGANSYVSVPLLAENLLLGLFVVGMDTLDAFLPAHIQTISEVAEMLTVAMRQAQLNRRLRQTNSELQELLRAKHEAMQDVSHELRSPLSLMSGFVDLLKDEVLGPLTTDQLSALDVLENKGDQLLIMVNRLLTLNTLEEAGLNKRSMALDSLLQEELQAWQVPAVNNHIRLVADIAPGMPTIIGDPNGLRRVVSNLLDNAIKFSESGGEIRLRSWSDDDSLLFVIEDQGTGIAVDQLESVFDRFFQTHKDSPGAAMGVGIGLALCKVIVEAHGGRIWAESEGENKGSAFFVCLPLGGKGGSRREGG